MEKHLKAIADELKKIRLELQFQNEVSRLPPLQQTDLPADPRIEQKEKAKIAQEMANK